MKLVLPQNLPAGTGIKLVPDLSLTRLVWYFIPVFLSVLIPVSDPIYQTNTGTYPVASLFRQA